MTKLISERKMFVFPNEFESQPTTMLLLRIRIIDTTITIVDGTIKFGETIYDNVDSL